MHNVRGYMDCECLVRMPAKCAHIRNTEDVINMYTHIEICVYIHIPIDVVHPESRGRNVQNQIKIFELKQSNSILIVLFNLCPPNFVIMACNSNSPGLQAQLRVR